MGGIYIFPSNSLHNIQLGIKHGLWAIQRQHAQKPQMVGKARAMQIGDRVILHLNEAKRWYGLFQVTQRPDEHRVVSDVWAGNYELPFGIGLVHQQAAVGTLYAPSLVHILPSLQDMNGPWTRHITKFRAMTSFQLQPFPDEDLIALASTFREQPTEEAFR